MKKGFSLRWLALMLLPCGTTLWAAAGKDVFGNATQYWAISAGEIKSPTDWQTAFKACVAALGTWDPATNQLNPALYNGFEQTASNGTVTSFASLSNKDVTLPSDTIVGNIQLLLKHCNQASDFGTVEGFETPVGSGNYVTANSLYGVIQEYLRRYPYVYDANIDGMVVGMYNNNALANNSPKANELLQLFGNMLSSIIDQTALDLATTVDPDIQSLYNQSNPIPLVIYVNSATGTSFLTLDSNGALQANSATPFVASAQFCLDLFQGLVGIRSLNSPNLYVTAPNITALTSSWNALTLAAKIQQSQLKAIAGNFAISIDPTTNGSPLNQWVAIKNTDGSFAFQNEQTKGFMSIDPDKYIRISDANLTAYPSSIASGISFMPLNAFHLALTRAKAIADPQSRLAAYTALVSPAQITTSQDLQFFVQEMQFFLMDCAASNAMWTALQAQEAALINLLVSIRTNFASSWTDPDAGAYLTSQLGSDTLFKSNADTAGVIKQAKLLQTYYYNKAASLTASMFQGMTYSDKVANLQTRLTSLSSSTLDTFINDLESLIKPQLSTSIAPTDAIVEASPADVVNLSNLISNTVNGVVTGGLVLKNAYIAAQATYQARVVAMQNVLGTTISPNVYMINLSNMLNLVSLTASDEASFINKATRLVTNSQIINSSTQTQQLLTILTRAMNNQMVNQQPALSALIQQLTSSAQAAQSSSGPTFQSLAYSAKVANLQSRLAALAANNIDQFINDLESIIKPAGATVMATDAIVQASSADITNLNNLISTSSNGMVTGGLVLKNAYIAAQTTYQARVAAMQKILATPIAYSVYVTYLANMLNQASFSATDETNFMNMANSLVTNIAQVQGNAAILQQLSSTLTRAMNNQVANQQAALLALIQQIAVAGAQIGSAAPTFATMAYSTKVANLQSRLNALTAGNIDAFINDLESIIKPAGSSVVATDAIVQASSTDITNLSNLISASTNGVVTGGLVVKNAYLAAQKTYQNRIAAMQQVLATPIAYNIYVTYLSNMLNQANFTDTDKTNFMSMANNLVTNITQAQGNNTVLQQLVNTLTRAMNNQISDQQPALLTMIQQIVASAQAAQAAQANAGPTFQSLAYSAKVANLQSRLATLAANNIDAFINDLESIIKPAGATVVATDAIVQASSADITNLNNLISTSSNGMVTGGLVLKNAYIAAQSNYQARVTAMQQVLATPIAYSVYVTYLANMLNQASFSATDETNFMNMATSLVTNIAQAKGNVAILQQLSSTLTRAMNNQVANQQAAIEALLQQITASGAQTGPSAPTFATMAYSTKVANLQSRLNALTAGNIDAFINDLESIIKPAGSSVVATDAIVQASSTDITNLSNLISASTNGVVTGGLVVKNAYLAAQKTYQNRIAAMQQVLATPIAYNIYVTYLSNMLNQANFTDTDKTNFMSMANNLVTNITQAQGNNTVLQQLVNTLTRAMNNQISDQQPALLTMIQQIVASAQAAQAAQANAGPIFQSLAYSAKVANLQSRLATLSANNIDAFINDLESIIKPAGATVVATDAIVQASSADITNLNNLISTSSNGMVTGGLVLKNAYIAAQSNYEARVKTMKTVLATPIDYSVYVTYLANMLNQASFSATDETNFMNMATSLVTNIAQAKGNVAILQQLSSTLTRAMNNQVANQQAAIEALLQQITASGAQTGPSAPTFATMTYSTKVANLQSRLNALTAGNIDQFIKDLESIIKPVGTAVAATDVIMQASANDITNLSNLISSSTNGVVTGGLVLKNAYLDAQSLYQGRISVLQKILATPIPYSVYVTYLGNMLNQATFADNDISNFMNVANSLVTNIAQAQGNNSVLQQLANILTRAMNNQVISQQAAINGLLSTVNSALQSSAVLPPFASALQSFMNMAADPNFNANSIPAFLQALAALVGNAVDAADYQLVALQNFLTNLLTTNQTILLYNNGSAQQTIVASIAQLKNPIDFTTRLNNLAKFVQAQPLANFVNANGSLNSSVDIMNIFIVPFVSKLESMINVRTQASSDQMTYLFNLISVVQANQMKLVLSSTYSNSNSIYNGQKVSDILNDIIGRLQGKQKFSDMVYSDQVIWLQNALPQLDSGQLAPAAFLDNVAVVVNSRIEGSSSDLTALINTLQAASYKKVISKATYLGQPASSYINSAISTLKQPLTFEDISDYLNSIISEGQLLADAQQGDFIAKAQMLVNLASSVTDPALISDQVNLFTSAKYNIVSGHNQSALDSVINSLTNLQQQAGRQSYSQQLASLEQQFTTLAGTIAAGNSTSAIQTSLQNLVTTTLPTLLANKVAASGDDLTTWQNLLQMVQWNQTLQSRGAVFSATLGNKTVSNSTIANLVSNLYQPFLNSPIMLKDRLAYLQSILARVNFADVDRADFLQGAKDLGANTTNASVADLTAVINFLNTARFNQMLPNKDDLASIINDLNNQLAVAQKATASSASVGAKLTYNQQITALDTARQNLKAETLNQFKADMQNLVTGQAQALAADITALQAVISKAATHPLFLQPANQGYDFAALQNALTTGAPFADQLTAWLATLQQSTLSATDQAWLLQKAKEMANLAATLSGTAQDVTNINTFITWLTSASNYQLSASANVLQTLISTLTTNVQSFQKAQATTSQTLQAQIDSCNAFLQNFYAMPSATAMAQTTSFFQTIGQLIQSIKGQLAVQSEVTNFVTFLQKLSVFYGLQQQYTSFLSNNKYADTTTLINLLTTPVSANNALSIYQAVFAGMQQLLTAGQQQSQTGQANQVTGLSQRDSNWIVEKCNNLVTDLPTLVALYASNSSSVTALLNNFLSLIQTAANYLMTDRAQDLDPVINALNNAIPALAKSGAAGVVQITPTSLSVRLDALTVNNVLPWLNDFASLTSGRIDMSDADVNTMINLLNTLQLKAFYAQVSSQKFNANQLISDAVAQLMTVFNTAPSFADRLNDIQTLYNANSATPLTAAQQASFISKAQRMLALKNPSLYSVDTTQDLLGQLETFLKVAAANKMISRKGDVLAIANQLSSYRAGLAAGIPVPYAQQIVQLQQSLSALTQDQVSTFMNNLTTLVNNRAQGLVADIATLQQWLQSPQLLNQPAIYRSNSQSAIATLLTTLASPVSLAERVKVLNDMISVSQNFSSDQKILFVQRLQDIVNGRGTASQDGVDLNAVVKTVNFVASSYFQAGETITINNTQSLVSDLLNSLAKQLLTAPPVGTVPTYTPFATVIANLQARLTNPSATGYVNSAVQATDFVTQLTAAVNNRADAVGTDIQALTTLVNSQTLKSNEYLYNLSPTFDFVTNLNTILNTPILYTDWVNNVTNLVSSYKTFDATLKQVFLAKIKQLFDNRSQANLQSFNLTPLQTLIGVVINNRFSPSTDQTAIAQLQSYQQNITSVPSSAAVEATFDFTAQFNNLQAMIPTLTASTYPQFITAINNMASNRANALLVNVNNNAQTVSVADSNAIDQTVLVQKWLTSSAVLLVPYIFQNNKATEVTNAAQGLLKAVSFNDLYTSAYNLLVQNSVLSANLTNILLGKVKKMVALQSQAVKENFSQKTVDDFMTFIIKNKVQNDPTSLAIMQTLQASWNNPQQAATTNAPDFNSYLSSFNNYFGINANGNVDYTKFNLTSDQLNSFVTIVQNLAANKVDGNSSDIANLVNVLQSPAVSMSRIIFTNTAQRKAIQAAITSLQKAPTYTDVANFLVDLINNNASFSDAQIAIFKDKLDYLVQARSNGIAENYDIAGLKQWIDFALVQQLAALPADQIMAINNQEKELLAPVVNNKVDDYVSFINQVKSFQAQSQLITAAASDASKAQQLVTNLQALVNNRLDGMIYDTSIKTDSLTDLNSLVTYIDKQLRYNPQIYGKNLEQILNGYLQSIASTVTFTELYTNFKGLVQASVNKFASDQEILFKNKLNRIVDRRGEASSDQLNDLVRLINFALINRFMNGNQPEVNNLLATLQTPVVSEPATTSATATISQAINSAMTQLQQLDSTAANSITTIQKDAWLANVLKPIAYTLNAGGAASTDIQNGLQVLMMARARIFANDVNNSYSSQVNSLVNMVQALVGNSTASNSTTSSAPVIPGLSNATSGTTATTATTNSTSDTNTLPAISGLTA